MAKWKKKENYQESKNAKRDVKRMVKNKKIMYVE